MDKDLMRVALEEARAALEHGDVPVGAVIARDGAVIARAHNTRERDNDPTGHAELLALRAAASSIGDWRLTGCTIYVTLEPDVMCAGALVLARIDRLVYGARDPKAGAVDSLYDVVRDPRLNHHIAVTAGVFEGECSELMRQFFSARRD